MVHMPAHIYQRVGRYADAIKSNQLAIAADEDYITQCRAQGLYPMAYYPHNIHFLWFAATARRAERGWPSTSARKVASKIDDDDARSSCRCTAGFRVVPYYALTRFGRWDEMLKEPEPPAVQRVPDARRGTTRAAWRSWPPAGCRGRAGARDAEGAAGRPVARRSRCSRPTPAGAIAGDRRRRCWPARSRRRAASSTRRSRTSSARCASRTRSSTPSRRSWHYPPRHALGAMLLEAGRAGRSRDGLLGGPAAQPRERLGAVRARRRRCARRSKDADAAIVEARRKAALARADVTLHGSRFGRAATAATAAAAAQRCPGVRHDRLEARARDRRHPRIRRARRPATARR